jgi:hypothetical protein
MQPITLVVGAAGAGKTTWIRQQLSDHLPAHPPALYLSPTTDQLAIDATYLAAELPTLTRLDDSQWPELLSRVAAGQMAYIELGCHLDLAALSLPFDLAQCRRVAVLPPGMEQTEWHDWVETVVIGAAIGAESSGKLQSPHLWRSPLSGQVLESASLNSFWYELTQGAYGPVQRAKGIFEVEDGRAVHYNFVAGLPESEYTDLNLPRWTDGRPERFSGVEVWGELEQADLAQTLEDCCLADHVIAHYQQQVKAAMEAEVR